MRNILVVNNTIFYEEGGELFLNKETGSFFVEIKSLGNNVSAFQISQPKTEKDSFANYSLTNKGIKIYEVKRRRGHMLAFFKSFFVIQKAVLKNDFTYIFYPGPICMFISLICIIYNKPYGLYVRGEQGIYNGLSKFILKRAKLIFTISPKFTQEISGLNKNVHTIRPMIGMSEIDIIKNKFLNFSSKINLVYVGRIVFDKGLFELLEALKILKEKKYNIHLNLVGSGNDLDALKVKVNEYRLNEYVSFLGMVSDRNQLIDIYKNNHIFILPTYHEGFPRVLYEAMLMHIPILTTFVGTINYLMKDKVNCLKLEPKSVTSIVESIELILNTDSLGQNLANNANKTIIEYLKDKQESHAVHFHKIINYYL